VAGVIPLGDRKTQHSFTREAEIHAFALTLAALNEKIKCELLEPLASPTRSLTLRPCSSMRHPVLVPLLAAACSLGVISAPAEVIFSESFAPGSLKILTPGSSAQWFDSRTSTAMVIDSGTLAIDTTGPSMSETWLAYLTQSGQPFTLEVGTQLTIRLVFTTALLSPTNENRHFRFGAYLSPVGHPRVENDTFPTGSGTGSFGPYTGYGAFINMSKLAEIEPIEVLKRTVLTNGDLLGSGGAHTRIDGLPNAGGVRGAGLPDTVPVGSPDLTPNGPYELILQFTRYAEDEVGVYAGYPAVPGMSHYAVDTSGVYTAFDTLAMRVDQNSTTASRFRFSAIQVIKTAAPPRPEPHAEPVLTLVRDAASTRVVWTQQALRFGRMQWANSLAGPWTGIGGNQARMLDDRVIEIIDNTDELADPALQLSNQAMRFYRVLID